MITPSTPELNRGERANNQRFPSSKEAQAVRIMSANVSGRSYLDNTGKVTAVFNHYKPDILAI